MDTFGVALHGCLLAKYACGCEELLIMDSTSKVGDCHTYNCVRPKYRDEVIEVAKKMQETGHIKLGRIN